MTGGAITTERRDGVTRWFLGVLLFCVACSLAWCVRHRGLYGDGPLFAELWNQGVWVFAHFLMFPIARLVQAIAASVTSLDGVEAMRITSVIATGWLVLATYVRVSRAHGHWPSAVATVFALAAPSLLLFAGAAEVHATTAAAVAVGAWLVSWPARHRTNALLLACLGYGLACLGHITCTLLGPAFLLLHVANERAVGRVVTPPRFAFSALALFFTGLAAIDALVWLEELVRHFGWYFPHGARSAWEAVDVSRYSALFKYLQAMVRWTGVASGPSGALLFVGEIATPIGVLGLLACAGFVPALRDRPLASLGHLLWIAALVFVTVRVDAREYGAYVLPALPALVWFAAAAFVRVMRARTGLVVVTWVMALACYWLAVDTFRAGRSGQVPGTPDRVPAGDLALPLSEPFGWNAAVDERDEPPRVAIAANDRRAFWFLGLAYTLALVSGCERWRRANRAPLDARTRRRNLIFASGACLLFLSYAGFGARAFVGRFGLITRELPSRLGEQAAAWRGPRDILLLVSPTHDGHLAVEWHWTLNYEVGRHGETWIDLGFIDNAKNLGEIVAVTGTMNQRLDEVRSAGGRVIVPDDTLGYLQQMKLQIALEYVRDLLARGAAERRPLTGLLPLADKVRDFESSIPH